MEKKMVNLVLVLLLVANRAVWAMDSTGSGRASGSLRTEVGAQFSGNLQQVDGVVEVGNPGQCTGGMRDLISEYVARMGAQTLGEALSRRSDRSSARLQTDFRCDQSGRVVNEIERVSRILIRTLDEYDGIQFRAGEAGAFAGMCEKLNISNEIRLGRVDIQDPQVIGQLGKILDDFDNALEPVECSGAGALTLASESSDVLQTRATYLDTELRRCTDSSPVRAANDSLGTRVEKKEASRQAKLGTSRRLERQVADLRQAREGVLVSNAECIQREQARQRALQAAIDSVAAQLVSVEVQTRGFATSEPADVSELRETARELQERRQVLSSTCDRLRSEFDNLIVSARSAIDGAEDGTFRRMVDAYNNCVFVIHDADRGKRDRLRGMIRDARERINRAIRKWNDQSPSLN